MSGLSHRAQPETIIEFGAPQSVSGVTVLLAYAVPLGDYEDLLFVVSNTGGAQVTVLLDTSEDGTYADAHAADTRTCGAGEQVSFEKPGAQLRSFWRLSTSGSSTVKWMVRGRPRT